MKNFGSIVALLVASASVISATPLPQGQAVAKLDTRNFANAGLQVESRRNKKGKRVIFVSSSRSKRRDVNDSDDSGDDAAEDARELAALTASLTKADPTLRTAAIAAYKAYEAADAANSPDEDKLEVEAVKAVQKAKASIKTSRSVASDKSKRVADYDSGVDSGDDAAERITDLARLETLLAKADPTLKAAAINAYKAAEAADDANAPNEEALEAAANAAIHKAKASIKARRSVASEKNKRVADYDSGVDSGDDAAEDAADLARLEKLLAKADPTLKAAAINAYKAAEAADKANAPNEDALEAAANAAIHKAKASIKARRSTIGDSEVSKRVADYDSGVDSGDDAAEDAADLARLEKLLAKADPTLKAAAINAYKAAEAADKANAPNEDALEAAANAAIRKAKASIIARSPASSARRALSKSKRHTGTDTENDLTDGITDNDASDIEEAARKAAYKPAVAKLSSPKTKKSEVDTRDNDTDSLLTDDELLGTPEADLPKYNGPALKPARMARRSMSKRHTAVDTDNDLTADDATDNDLSDAKPSRKSARATKSKRYQKVTDTDNDLTDGVTDNDASDIEEAARKAALKPARLTRRTLQQRRAVRD